MHEQALTPPITTATTHPQPNRHDHQLSGILKGLEYLGKLLRSSTGHRLRDIYLELIPADYQKLCTPSHTYCIDYCLYQGAPLHHSRVHCTWTLHGLQVNIWLI